MVKHLKKFLKPKFFNFIVCNLCQSSPSSTILVPSWFIIFSLVFFYLCIVLFSGFLQFKGNLVHLMFKITHNTMTKLLGASYSNLPRSSATSS